MLRLATILTARPALRLSCLLLALVAVAAPVASAQADPAPAPAATKSPSTLANQPVPSPREPAAPASPAAPKSPALPDDQKLIDLAKQLSTSTPATPVTPSDVAAPGKGEVRGKSAESTPLHAREKSATSAATPTPSPSTALTPGGASDGRLLSARRRAETVEPEAAAPSTGGGWIPTIAALGGIIGLILVLRAGLSRWTGATAAGRSAVVQVLTRVAIAPRNHVLLLRVGGRVLVVGDSAAGMRTLAQIDDPEEIADLLTSVSSAKTNSITAGFRQMLSGFSGEYGRETSAAVGTDEQEVRIDRARDKVGGLVGKIRSLTGKGGAA